MLAIFFFSWWFLRPCIEILQRMLTYRGSWFIYLCELCACKTENKSQVIINKLVNKSRHVLYQFYAICARIISIKLYTNWKLLFRSAIIV